MCWSRFGISGKIASHCANKSLEILIFFTQTDDMFRLIRKEMDKMVDTATWFDELTRSRAKGKVGFIFCNVRLSTLRSVHMVRQQLRFFLFPLHFCWKYSHCAAAAMVWYCNVNAKYFATAAAAQNRVGTHLLAVPLLQPLPLLHHVNESICYNGIQLLRQKNRSRCRTVWTDLYGPICWIL